MEKMQCRVCKNELNNEFVELQATMYGTKGKFPYFICAKCGCMQIVSMPVSMEEYYDNTEYYAFNMQKRKLKNHLLFSMMKKQVQKWNVLGWLVEWIYPVNYKFYRLVKRECSILDVGCGQGEMLLWLRKLGYQNLQGIDPYLSNDAENEGIRIYKSEILEYQPEQKYDMVTFIHSLEHIFPIHETISKLNEWVKKEGYVVFQLPVLSGYYWKKYGKNLYTLDPPRHFYIHTKESLEQLMIPYGYELVAYETEFDAAIPMMARNIKKGKTEKNQGTGFLSGAVVSLASTSLRKRLKKADDGAIATVVFKKI